MPVVITNTGTAPADDVELSGSAPSGWKVEFNPKSVDHIAPNANKEVQALITPTDKAIAGDYVTTISRRRPRRIRVHRLPRHRNDIHDVGHRRRRHHRHCASGHGRRGGKVRPPMSGDSVIEAKDLTKTYGQAVAVDHISFSVGRGEIFGLLGPNGAGKTTTILMLLGLTDISGGEVSVLGFNPAREPLSVKRRVGYLPDTVGFYDQLTAADNLRYTARLIGFRFNEREKRIAEALERVGLADFADHHVGTYSRGMRQRLGLAEILMKGAQIAILDEPTSGLDPHATSRTPRHHPPLQGGGRVGSAVVALA